MAEVPDHRMLEREIFLTALDETDPVKREAVIDECCRGDAELRARIECLLYHHARDSDIFRDVEMTGSGRSRLRLSGSPSTPWEPPSVEELDPHFDAYRLDALLGRGGMGVVYRGIQISLERLVAIKILRPDIADDEAFARRFRREALSMAQLSHPNLVSIIDFGSITVEVEEADGGVRDGTLYYLVMEFVEGRDLHQIIRSGHLDHGSALAMISQICDALEYAHGKGYVHRDIKPANIFVTGDGVIKVGDFGLATFARKQGGDEDEVDVSRLTQTGYILGTPDYMAPESLESDRTVDHRSDIYSLGVMFYEMLTGKLPKGCFPPPSERVQIDVRIDEVVLKAMHSEPDLRYQRASEVKRDVTSITESTRVSKEKKPSRRFPWLILLLVAVAVLVLVLFLGKGRVASQPTTDQPSLARKDLPFVNRLGMRFVPVPIPSGPTAGRSVLFSIWETRVRDFRIFCIESGKGFSEFIHPHQNENHPVLASWDDAVSFCEWLTVSERKAGTIGENDRFRLPTDHEWSIAVGIGQWEDPDLSPLQKSSGVIRIFPWGTGYPPPAGAGNFFGEETSVMNAPKSPIPGYTDPFPFTAPVGQFSPNEFGLYDLAGNVCEACSDWHDPEKRETRTFRGSCWGDVKSIFLISSERSGQAPGVRNESAGFRCVLELGGRGEMEEAVDLPPAADSPSQPPGGFPAVNLPLPTKDFPDLTTLPKGRVRFWSSHHFGPETSIHDAGKGNDFVEVTMVGDTRWAGLQPNGDVLIWSPETGLKDHRIGQEVAVMRRCCYQYSGQWLSRDGTIVVSTHPDGNLSIGAPRKGIVDLAKTDFPDHAYTLLMNDGRIISLPGESGSPPVPAPEVDDLVRIEASDTSIFGIRREGELISWGTIPPEFR